MKSIFQNVLSMSWSPQSFKSKFQSWPYRSHPSKDDSSPFCWPNIAILLCNAENVHAHWKLCPPITYFSESFGDARAVQIFILVCHLSLWLLSNDNEKLLQLGFGTMGLLFIRRYKSVVIWSFLKQMGSSYHMQWFQLIFILFFFTYVVSVHCSILILLKKCESR